MLPTSPRMLNPSKIPSYTDYQFLNSAKKNAKKYLKMNQAHKALFAASFDPLEKPLDYPQLDQYMEKVIAIHPGISLRVS